MKIAIHQNEKIFKHSSLWASEWISFCEKQKIDYKIVDCYSLDILEQLKEFDCLLWHFENYSLQDMLFARTILLSAKNIGLKVFPDFNTSWHFDDKIAEYYILKSVGAPIPRSWIFYTKFDCLNWLKKQAQYPLIAKLKTGSGSNNVKLLSNPLKAVRYTKRMFGNGFKNVPGILFKTISNVRTSYTWATAFQRFKRIPDFLETYSRSRQLPPEHGYTYFQEFIPNDGFDLKIVVIGDKLSFFARRVRKNDFRASGGANFYFDKSLVSSDILKSAFETYDKLNLQCVGFDYVIDNRINTGKIIEMSYGFSYTALMQAAGYWDRNGTWHDEAVNAPIEIIKNLIK